MAEGGGNGSPALPEAFAATLASLAEKAGVEAGEGGDDVDVTAAAGYLKPQIDRLLQLETGLPGFPASPASTPWFKIENEVLDPNSREAVIDIAKRYGATKNHTYGWSKKRRWKERRAVILEIQARMTASATMLALGARVSPARKALAENEETQRTLALLDRTLAVYEAQLESGQVPVRPADVDKIVRLAKFLRGHADHIKEHRLAVTPQTVLTAAKKAAKSIGAVDPELAGIVTTDAEFNVIEDDDAGEGGVQPEAAAGDSETPSEQAPAAMNNDEESSGTADPAQNGGASSSPTSSAPDPDSAPAPTS